jgi:hypothetical protein
MIVLIAMFHQQRIGATFLSVYDLARPLIRLLMHPAARDRDEPLPAPDGRLGALARWQAACGKFYERRSLARVRHEAIGWSRALPAARP